MRQFQKKPIKKAKINTDSQAPVKKTHASKAKLHPRNPHNAPYDLERLATIEPGLKAFFKQTPRGDLTLDFAQADAVKLLNKALLNDQYGIQFWGIPPNALCPAVPGRADYIHYIADLLAQDIDADIPKGRAVKGLDIGTGANCIYPLIGAQSYGWSFVGADINTVSIDVAKHIVASNPLVKQAIKCRLQKDSNKIFSGIIQPGEYFAFSLCNPPFHSSIEEAAKGTQRKHQHLNAAKPKEDRRQASQLNFAGQGAELWCEGGELAFVKRIVDESLLFKDQCLWFTCLISKKDNVPAIKRRIQQIAAKDVQVINMAQGQKQSRFIAWSFLSKAERATRLNNMHQ